MYSCLLFTSLNLVSITLGYEKATYCSAIGQSMVNNLMKVDWDIELADFIVWFLGGVLEMDDY